MFNQALLRALATRLLFIYATKNPSVLNIMFSGTCQNACTHCYFRDETPESGLFSERSFPPDIVRRSYRKIRFVGTREPLAVLSEVEYVCSVLSKTSDTLEVVVGSTISNAALETLRRHFRVVRVYLSIDPNATAPWKMTRSGQGLYDALKTAYAALSDRAKERCEFIVNFYVDEVPQCSPVVVMQSTLHDFPGARLGEWFVVVKPEHTVDALPKYRAFFASYDPAQTSDGPHKSFATQYQWSELRLESLTCSVFNGVRLWPSGKTSLCLYPWSFATVSDADLLRVVLAFIEQVEQHAAWDDHIAEFAFLNSSCIFQKDFKQTLFESQVSKLCSAAVEQTCSESLKRARYTRLFRLQSWSSRFSDDAWARLRSPMYDARFVVSAYTSLKRCLS